MFERLRVEMEKSLPSKCEAQSSNHSNTHTHTHTHTIMFEPQKPVNVTLFGHTVSAEIIKLRQDHTVLK
jgi:hypothetical protein